MPCACVLHRFDQSACRFGFGSDHLQYHTHEGWLRRISVKCQYSSAPSNSLLSQGELPGPSFEPENMARLLLFGPQGVPRTPIRENGPHPARPLFQIYCHLRCGRHALHPIELRDRSDSSRGSISWLIVSKAAWLKSEDTAGVPPCDRLASGPYSRGSARTSLNKAGSRLVLVLTKDRGLGADALGQFAGGTCLRVKSSPLLVP
jgi:hypothetical protein